MGLYDRDFHAWAHQQAALARSRAHNALDWDNVAEELESLGKQQVSELRSRFEVLLAHLLKWSFQPDRRSRSWSNTIREQRRRIREHVADNPSLKAASADTYERAYQSARVEASSETDLDLEVFPVHPPLTIDEAMDDDFWPEPRQPD